MKSKTVLFVESENEIIRWSKILIVLFSFALMTAGCSTSVNVKPDFYQDKTCRVGVVTCKLPQAKVHITGAGGLIGLVTESIADASLNAYLSKMEIKTFKSVAGKFVSELKKRGINAWEIEDVLDLEKRNEKKTEEFYRQKVEDYQVDKLIILAVDSLGATRHMGNAVAIYDPQGYCYCYGKMFDSKGNILWNAKMNWDDGCAVVIGEWNQPPDYPNLTKAFLEAIEQGKRFLLIDFFVNTNR